LAGLTPGTAPNPGLCQETFLHDTKNVDEEKPVRLGQVFLMISINYLLPHTADKEAFIQSIFFRFPAIAVHIACHLHG
jgi:hypothetical protein